MFPLLDTQYPSICASAKANHKEVAPTEADSDHKGNNKLSIADSEKVNSGEYI